METEGSSPYTQQSDVSPYPEPDKINPRPLAQLFSGESSHEGQF